MSDFSVQKQSNKKNSVGKKQSAAKALNNYLNQLKIHFDFNDRDIVKVLELILKEKKHESFIKKWWHMFK